MPTLTSAIDATQKQIAVSNPAQSLARGTLVRIDDEVMAFDRYGGDNRPGHRDFSTWFVYRGRNNSVAAAHSQGATVQAAVDAFLAGTFGDPPGPFDAGAGGASDAASVSYDNTESGLTAEDVQAALDEVAAAPGGTPTLAEVLAEGNDPGGEVIEVTRAAEDNAEFAIETYAEDGSAAFGIEAYSETGSGTINLVTGSGAKAASMEILSNDSLSRIGFLAEQMGFFDASPSAQPAAIADATDNPSAITQLNDLLAKLRALGIIAT